MQTARFEQLRKRALEKVFNISYMVTVWRDIVRQQLRSQDIKDLFDYFDFNYNIKDRSQAIRASILNGDYKASQPLVYKIEKKLGISRHMIIPQAVDALVLQILTESVASKVLKKQPSKKAFYSRSKNKSMKPHEVAEYGMALRTLWIKMQKIIYKFSETKELIVTTDLSNYYDSIDMRELKKVFTTYLNSCPEVIIDLLFGVIEDISWRPDYLPYSNRGLPTSNLEAIRLLAHSFLFEVDEVLKKKTHDSFTRWMDDIVIGVDTKKEARETISAISDMLKSRGLALNQAKTDIYSPEDAAFHFQIEQNEFIESVKVIPKSDSSYNTLTTFLLKKFKEHNIENKSARAWDKVTKRYITLFGKLKSEKLLSQIKDLYINFPSLRSNLLIYLSNLGYKKSTGSQIIKILDAIDIFDDISLYQISNLIVSWEIDDKEDSKKFIIDIEKRLTNFAFSSRRNPLDFYSLLWFKAKYSRSDEMLNFLIKYQNLWQSDAFLRRQATSVLSRAYISDEEKVKQLLKSQISSGEPNTVSLANQLQLFLEMKAIDFNLNSYLFPSGVIQKPYPLPKFLVLCSILNSDTIRKSAGIRSKIMAYISDPYYLKWLEQNYNIH